MITKNSDVRTINESNSPYAAGKTLNSVRRTIKDMGRGGIAKVSRASEVNKNKVARFVSGGEISASSFVAIENAVAKLTNESEVA